MIDAAVTVVPEKAILPDLKANDAAPYGEPRVPASNEKDALPFLVGASLLDFLGLAIWPEPLARWRSRGATVTGPNVRLVAPPSSSVTVMVTE